MNLSGRTTTELVASIRETVPATIPLDLDLGGTSIRVLSSTHALHDALADYFAEFMAPCAGPDILITAHETAAPVLDLEFKIKPPETGKTKIKEEWADLPGGRVVRKRLTGMHFLFGQGENAAIGPCLDNANQVINFVNNRFIERTLNSGGLLGHAAGVVHHGRGMSLAGFSGAGKSTLALHLMSRGTTFVSNDRVMVRDTSTGLMMYGVAKQPRINPGTALNNPDLADIVSPEDAQRLLAMPLDELWSLESKYDALIHECFGPNRFVLAAPMRALVILNWKHGAGATGVATVDPQQRTDLLPAFMKPTGLFYLPDDPARTGDPGQDEYAALLSGADLIEFTGGVDFDLAADICMAYLETGILP
ncbi:MAG: HprK-related kinase B [Proteobacteria bacterium]|nr:HprK-related kinase B [Pseudomonadota bacterium]